ncbi:hypothetical protein Salat_1430500 [Sesamum alatum]|uniref:Uncharacterized protein n=1 Tax=Sesamum alatum TaxID=300844 RepID=A0AAE2CLK8_9LAMI|nr:hypothetical protein Salat_1430500 [Sesamum alatum]
MRVFFEEYLHAVPSRYEQCSVVDTISGCDDDIDIMMDEFDSYRSQYADARSQSQLNLYLAYDSEDDEDENCLSTNIENLVARLDAEAGGNRCEERRYEGGGGRQMQAKRRQTMGGGEEMADSEGERQGLRGWVWEKR